MRFTHRDRAVLWRAWLESYFHLFWNTQRAVSPMNCTVSASGLSVLWAQLISGKIIKQQERETKSKISEGGRLKSCGEKGMGGHLHEEAASSMMGIKYTMTWGKGNRGLRVKGFHTERPEWTVSHWDKEEEYYHLLENKINRNQWKDHARDVKTPQGSETFHLSRKTMGPKATFPTSQLTFHE